MNQDERGMWKVIAKDLIRKTVKEAGNNLTTSQAKDCIGFITTLANNDLKKRLRAADKRLVPEILEIVFNCFVGSLEQKIKELQTKKPRKKRAGHNRPNSE